VNLDSSGLPVNTNRVLAGVVETVRAMVTVAPQITFEVVGVDSSTNVCNNNITTTVTTTGVEVPFGDISSMMFSDAAQQLSVTTNAANGYVLTVTATDQLSLDGAGCPGTNTGMNVITCINDFVGSDMASASDEPALDTPTPWTDVTVNGFGYTIGTPATAGGAYVDAQGVSHSASSVNDWSSDDGFKKFPDQSAAGAPGDLIELPRVVMQNSSSTNGDTVDFCYRITPSADTVSGDYSTNILFTATATF
jgi:hypothetical protein